MKYLVSLVIIGACVSLLGCDLEAVGNNSRKEKALTEIQEIVLSDRKTRCVFVGDYFSYAAIHCDWIH